ncbi:MAG: nicotinate phosphoribosyltransferase [Candidatus Omnitrophica bacterium]|nr:nicotinate phosphoribosyltransferase [Candidatus Omnitrophota bacterium]
MRDNNFRLDSGLWVDLYELAMAQVYFKYKKSQRASFELFIRSRKRPFYIACGISEALEFLKALRFTSQDVEYLRGLKLFEDDFLKFLKNFRFRGEVWSLDEPEIIFPQEPIMRVTAGLIEAQIVESGLLNIINLHTTLATKAQRVVIAAKARKVYDFSLRRTQGLQASLAAARTAFICGAEGTSNVLAGKLYNIPVAGTMAHSFVMSFASELDSFYAFAKTFPEKTILLIDTYDIDKALKQAVKVAGELKKNKCNLIGLRIDSGDLLELSKHARRELDTHDLIDVIIFASGNLDEYKIKELVDKSAPIDAFGVGTNMGTSSDAPFSDVIYKLVEVKDSKDEFVPVMKFSQDKLTFPFSKQVFRHASAKGLMKQDFIGLAAEKVKAKPLLKKVMAQGEILEKREDALSQRKKLKKKLEGLPSELKKIDSAFVYPVNISNKLNKAAQLTKALIEKRSRTKNILFVDIDTQFDFVDKKGALYVKDADKLTNIWAKLTKFAFDNQIKIIASQDAHSKNDPEFKQFPPHCIKGTSGARKISKTTLDSHIILSNKALSFEELFRIKEEFPQIILETLTLDIFSNPNALTLLKAIAPDEVYVYGVATEYCVKCACLGFKKIMDKVFVIEDAIKEISAEARQETFSEFKRKGIQFIKAFEVLERSIDA